MAFDYTSLDWNALVNQAGNAWNSTPTPEGADGATVPHPYAYFDINGHPATVLGYYGREAPIAPSSSDEAASYYDALARYQSDSPEMQLILSDPAVQRPNKRAILQRDSTGKTYIKYIDKSGAFDPWSMLPFAMFAGAAALAGGAAAGGGAAGGAAASSGTGAAAAGAGAAGAGEAAAGLGGWVSAEGGAGYLGGMAADASALGGAGAAGLGGAGWTSAEGGLGYSGGAADFGALSGNTANSVGAASLPSTSSASGLSSLFGGNMDWLDTALKVGGPLLNGFLQSKAVKDGSELQGAAALAGIDEQRRQFDAVQKMLSPYVNAGTAGLGGQMDLAGLNGAGKQQGAISALQNSPEFAAYQQQGENAILQNASATGGLRGGNVQAALGQFRPQLLAQLINDQYGRLGGLTSLGQNAAAGVGNAGMQTGTNVSNLLQQQGAAQAGGALGTAGAYSNALGGIYSGLGFSKGLNGKVF
jgi:hypothetical protein